MACKSACFTVKQPLMLETLDAYLNTQANRTALGNYLGGVNEATFSIREVFALIQGEPVDSDPARQPRTLAIDYSIKKMFGNDPIRRYFSAIDGREAELVCFQALNYLVALNKPTVSFWVTTPWATLNAIDKVKVDFKAQITEHNNHTSFHLMTPQPDTNANSPTGPMNKKERSWLIGRSPTINRQADAFNELHHELSTQHPNRPQPDPGTFTTEFLIPGVKSVQLRNFDPDQIGQPTSFSNDVP